jgi:hypothetical protein
MRGHPPSIGGAPVAVAAGAVPPWAFGGGAVGVVDGGLAGAPCPGTVGDASGVTGASTTSAMMMARARCARVLRFIVLDLLRERARTMPASAARAKPTQSMDPCGSPGACLASDHGGELLWLRSSGVSTKCRTSGRGVRRKSARPRARQGRGIDAAPQLQYRRSRKDTHMQKKLVVATLTLLLWPALIVAQKTSYDYEKTANFAGFKTYAHKQGTPVGQSLIDDRITAAIESQLGAKGLTKAESDPDVFVVYHMAFDKEKDISTYSSGHGGYGAYGWGWGGGWAGGTTSTQVRDILVGTLVIDMADARKSQLVWRGMGVKEVDTQANPEKRDKSINKAVEKIFKNYPPKVKT